MVESKKFRLNLEDIKKLGKGLLIALGGCALTYLVEIVPSIEFGIYTPLAVATASVIVNTLRKSLSGKK